MRANGREVTEGLLIEGLAKNLFTRFPWIPSSE